MVKTMGAPLCLKYTQKPFSHSNSSQCFWQLDWMVFWVAWEQMSLNLTEKCEPFVH